MNHVLWPVFAGAPDLDQCMPGVQWEGTGAYLKELTAWAGSTHRTSVERGSMMEHGGVSVSSDQGLIQDPFSAILWFYGQDSELASQRNRIKKI